MAWKKLLYVAQDVPDNYTHRTFLRELRTNGRPARAGVAPLGV